MLRQSAELPLINKTYTKAVEVQQFIVIHHMAVGLMALAWNNVLKASKVNHPQTETKLIIDSIWDDLCKAL